MEKKRTDRKLFLKTMLPVVLCLLLLFMAPACAETNPEPYDRVIIFGVDGAGNLFPGGDTPNFHRIFDGGVITNEARATVPTVSAPGWGSVLYGVPGAIHGVDNAYAVRFHKYNELYPSIFKLTREAFPDAAMASFANWSPINWGLIERDCGVVLFPDDESDPPMEETTQKVLAYLEENDPKLLFVYYGDLDNTMHSYGIKSKQYYDVMKQTDEQFGKVYDKLKQRGLLDNALILFITDHGGIKGSHGGGSDEETKITFAAAGPRLETQGTLENVEIQDVAAIALYALGIEQPAIQTGRVPKGLFPGVGTVERKVSPLPERLKTYEKGITNAERGEPSLPESLTEKLVYYQNFDGEFKGLAGKKELAPGLIGNGLKMENSFLKTGIKNKAKWSGMTVAFWFKNDGEYGDPVFVTDKNWLKGEYKGFTIAKTNEGLHVNVGGGRKYRGDIIWQLPPQYQGKWMHCLVVFDQSTRQVSLYCDFVLVARSTMLPAKYSTWVSQKGIIVGQDTSGKYKFWMKGNMDELMIFKEPLTDEEIDEIRMSYEPFFTQIPAEP